jgi:hypothetical protein
MPTFTAKVVSPFRLRFHSKERLEEGASATRRNRRADKPQPSGASRGRRAGRMEGSEDDPSTRVPR